jgi:hypothetical protein
MSALDDASDANDEESIIVITQFDSTNSDHILAQANGPKKSPDRKTINSNLVLLDSQSTVDLFTNPEHMHNICPATKPINVHCNKGTLTTSKEADFGDTPVYFNDRGIANVLSLYCLGKKFQVTYDSNDRGGVFHVHTMKGIVEFKPTNKGLHALNLKTNLEAAFLLVNNADLHLPPPDHQLHVATVQVQFDGFSCKQIEGAHAAHRLMGMVATPSTWDFHAMIRLNMLKDCPITTGNINHAHTLFGPDLATIRGKTVPRKPARVVTDYVEIPRTLVNVNQQITLAVNVMFVNSVPVGNHSNQLS